MKQNFGLLDKEDVTFLNNIKKNKMHFMCIKLDDYRSLKMVKCLLKNWGIKWGLTQGYDTWK